MHPILRNILAVIAGIVVGAFVNGFIISISGSIIPPPAGSDLTTMEGLSDAMKIMEPKHFIMPFLAHALGTLFGAFVISLLSINHKFKLALIAGVLFFVGGLMMVMGLPGSPTWFNALDLILAYFPMASIGAVLGIKLSKK